MLVDPKSGVAYSFGEKLSSSHVSIVWAQQPNAFDAVNGGTWTLGTNATINGAASVQLNHLTLSTGGSSAINHGVSINVSSGGQITWVGTTGLPTIGTRTYTLGQPMILRSPLVGWVLSTAVSGAEGCWVNSDTASQREIWFSLTRMPHLSTLKGISVYLDGNLGGGGSHGGLPGIMPDVTVITQTAAGSTVFGTTTDSSASTAAYDAVHSIDYVISAPVADTEFSVRVRGESGANAVNNALAILYIEADFECTVVAPG